MPRNGANVYAKPVGTTPIDGDDIDAAPFNLLMDDIATDLNTPRPVVAGGTGASNAPAALVSLGALSTASGLSDLLAPSKGLANLHGYATTVKSGGTTTLTAASAVYQRFTGVSTQSVVLPDAGTLQLGSFFELHNNDTNGSLTVKSADGSTIMTALAGQIVRLVCVLASGTTAASWRFAVCGFPGVTGNGNAVLNNDPIMARPTLFNPQVQVQSTLVAGTDAQGQGLITGDLVVVITTAANPSGVTLPAALAGRWITVVNRGTNPINVYPALGAAIDAGAANAPVQIAVGAGATFSAKTTTAWESSVQLSKVAFDALSLLNLSSALSGAAGAPYVQGVWHPYNSLAVGDANTGVIYDFAVHGAVSAIVTPNFEDGYEYEVRFQGVTQSTSNTRVEAYRETSGAYGDVFSGAISLSGTWVNHYFVRPRDVARLMVTEILGPHTQGSNGSPGGTQSVQCMTHTTAQKIRNIRYTMNAGATLTSGIALLYRRRVF